MTKKYHTAKITSKHDIYTPIKDLQKLRNYQLYLIRGGKRIPINFGEIEWRDNIETLGMELHFEFPRNFDDKHYRRHDVVKMGDKVLFMNKDKELFRGMITSIDYDRYSKKVTAHDYAYFLNKSETIIQFNKVSGSAAIRRLCKKHNVPIGKIDNMSVKITEIYRGQTISDVIKDIIDKQKTHNGGKYRMEMQKDKLYVVKHKNLRITPTFEPPARLKGKDKEARLAQISRSDTLDDTYTKVVVIMEEEKKIKRLATVVDNNNLKKYGLFQKVVSINKEESKRAKRIAQETLNEHKGIQRTISLTMMGDDNVRSGRTIYVKNPTYALNGDFLITDCRQYFKNNNRWMDLQVRRV